jgi:predicted dehydrogenase
VIGTGRLGREHARIYASLDEVGSLMLYDQDGSRAGSVAAEFGARTCSTIEELLDGSDVASVCTPATNHYPTASIACRKGVHILVEKPLAASSTEGEMIVREAREAGCVLQVGHVERFNGAFQAVRTLLTEPRFIESHRLATFTPRGTDVSVVVDLMIHDIDLVLTVLEGDRIAELRASGTGVLTDSLDIVNARIQFESGCVANITASRISREPLRKIRFFQENLYVSVDLKVKRVEAFEKVKAASYHDLAADPTAFIHQRAMTVDQEEPLRKEIQSFIDAVRSKNKPTVTGEQALDALLVAEQVLDSLQWDGGRG